MDDAEQPAEAPGGSRVGARVRLGLLVALVAAAVTVQLTVGLPSTDEVRAWLDGLGPWAAPAYVGVYVLVCLLPTGPVALLTVLGGVALGAVVGVVAALTGAVLGATSAFTVGRVLGRDSVQRSVGGRARALDEQLGRHALLTVMVVRLVPFVPYSASSYAFGLTAVGWRGYVVGTAVGVLPSTVALVVVGAYGAEPGSWPFVVAVVALLALSVFGAWRIRVARR